MTSPNPILRKTLVLLERTGRRKKAPIWTVASELLRRPSSSSVEVNLSRIGRIADEGEVLLVPGKVLGFGTIDKKLTVGAFAFSASAKDKIVAKGGTAISLEDLVRQFPDGRGVRLVE
jgi:large subunit ribosomal protein L18e